MLLLLLLFGFALCGLALLLVLEAAFRPGAERQASFRRVASYATVQSAGRAATGRRPNVFKAIVPALSRVTLRFTPRVRREDIQLRLASAGVTRITAQQFFALKTTLGFIAILLGFVIGGLGVGGFLLAVALVGCSFVLPDFALSRMARERAERLTAHLPQAIDLIVISLEAGLGFDAAASYFARRAKTPLAGELRVMLSEIRMGETRTSALKRLAERVPSDEMRAFVQTLVQSEGVGISRVGILRSQATDIRHRRQLAAEERANKAPVKMLIPTVVFILPVMFVFILGPAFQQASNIFGGS